MGSDRSKTGGGRGTTTTRYGRTILKHLSKAEAKKNQKAAEVHQRKKDSISGAIHQLDRSDTEALQRQYIRDKMRELNGKMMQPHPLPDWERLAPPAVKQARDELTNTLEKDLQGAFEGKDVQLHLDPDSASAFDDSADWADGQGEEVRRIGGKLYVDGHEHDFEYEQRALYFTTRGQRHVVPGSETAEYKLS